ncbi:MAG: DUF4931 domain-containing protein [Patescibacteria group bacterium]
MKSEKVKSDSEFRQDPISGDCILFAPLRGAGHRFEGRAKMEFAKNKCPFENPAKFGNKPPVLVYQDKTKNDWFLQIIPNKSPAVGPKLGSHDVVIYRDHERHLANFTKEEIKMVLLAFQERYKSLAEEKNIKYISIFHNHGKEAGSTIPHPHSQILALPILPPYINRSVNASRRYFKEHNKCTHCQMIGWELKEKKRVVYQNSDMVVIAPFASRAEFELAILPKKHFAYFEKIKEPELSALADALKVALQKIYKKLKDPAFNFFIHTAPVDKNSNHSHYHWHLEIMPKFDIIGGFELSTGLDIVAVYPEKAAEIFKK